jgi:NADH-quinone oxidoreductase subunit L
VIDGLVVNGSANLAVRVAALVRRLQSGFLFHYAFAMIVGLIALLGGLWWFAAHGTP